MAAVSAACGAEAPSLDDPGVPGVPDAGMPDGAGSPDGGETPDGADTPDGATLPDAPVDGDMPDAPPSGASWQIPELLENIFGSATMPDVGMDSAGRAIVVWQHGFEADDLEGFNDNFEVRANRYDPASGWGTDIALTTSPGARHPDIAVNAAGDAMVVWHQSGGVDYTEVWARGFRPSTGWEPATLLADSMPGANTFPRVAIAGDGSAIAMWSQRTGLDQDLYARRFVPSTGWGPAVLVHAPAGDAQTGDLAIDGSGRAVAVWTVRAGGGTLWGSRFTPADGWTAPIRLDADAASQGAANATSARVGVDAAGNAVVVWDSLDGQDRSVWALNAPANGTWETPMRLDSTPDGYAMSVDVAVAASGDAIAVWYGWVDNTMSSIRARRFTPGAGWSAMELVESSPASSVFPRIAMAPDGTATVAWCERGSTPASTPPSIMANRFVPGTGWGMPTPITSTTSGRYSSPAVATGGPDGAIVVWPHDPQPVDNHPTPFDLWGSVFR